MLSGSQSNPGFDVVGIKANWNRVVRLPTPQFLFPRGVSGARVRASLRIDHAKAEKGHRNADHKQRGNIVRQPLHADKSSRPEGGSSSIDLVPAVGNRRIGRATRATINWDQKRQRGSGECQQERDKGWLRLADEADCSEA
jgi:hypothetical protein